MTSLYGTPTVVCSRCQGTGVERGDRWEKCRTCPVCRGIGKLTMTDLGRLLKENSQTLKRILEPKTKQRREVMARICTKICTLLEKR